MKANVSDVPIGTNFTYNGMEFVVVGSNYTFAECRCITEPNEYEHNVIFGGAGEMVDVLEGAKFYKQAFVEVSPHYYVRKEELI